MISIEVRVHLRALPVDLAVAVDHLERCIILHGCCCGGAAAAWKLLLVGVVRAPSAASVCCGAVGLAAPGVALAALLDCRFLLVSYRPLGFTQLIGEAQRKTAQNFGFVSYLSH